MVLLFFTVDESRIGNGRSDTEAATKIKREETVRQRQVRTSAPNRANTCVHRLISFVWLAVTQHPCHHSSISRPQSENWSENVLHWAVYFLTDASFQPDPIILQITEVFPAQLAGDKSGAAMVAPDRSFVSGLQVRTISFICWGGDCFRDLENPSMGHPSPSLWSVCSAYVICVFLMFQGV